MKKAIFKNEEEVKQVKVSRPGSDGYALFRMVFDPERGETESAVMGIHEHPPGVEPIVPHYHQEVEETVYIVSGEGTVKLGATVQSMMTYSFRPGSSWFVPPDWWHQIINRGGTLVKMVVSYFRNDGRPVSHKLVSGELTVVASAE